MQTLYQFGKEATLRLIAEYLALMDATDGLAAVREENFARPSWRALLLGGKGFRENDIPSDAPGAYALYRSRQAIEHDIQTAVSGPLYSEMRIHALDLARQAESLSDGFSTLTAAQLHDAPELLPIFMHAAGIFSLSVLRRDVGSISDSNMSRNAADRATAYLVPRFVPNTSPERLVERLGSTIEGQVRDLLGRYLLEAVVEAAFDRLDVSYQRENEYSALAGVVYDHRADFVVPNAENPKLFVEVRRSSARHSSLYAKDKMFSAINWKGKHPDLIGVLVIDGDWSRHSRLALSRVFDYVLPVSHADELAKVASAYLGGDTSKLLRLIHFDIQAPGNSPLPPRP